MPKIFEIVQTKGMKTKKRKGDVKREIKMQKVLKEHRNASKDDRKGKMFWKIKHFKT